jgi:hypothetical protein
MEKKHTVLDLYVEQSQILQDKFDVGLISFLELCRQKVILLEQAKRMEETEYKERLVKEFNPRLFNKPSKELPTDEEIYELAEKILAVDYLSFTDGAKWMRDKIKGGDNE